MFCTTSVLEKCLQPNSCSSIKKVSWIRDTFPKPKSCKTLFLTTKTFSWSNGCTEKWVWSSILTWNWKSTQSKPHSLKQMFKILKLKNWVSYLWDTSISLSGNWLTISWRKILCLNQSRSFDFWACLQKARLQKARYQARTYLQPHYANVVFGNVYLNIASTPLL